MYSVNMLMLVFVNCHESYLPSAASLGESRTDIGDFVKIIICEHNSLMSSGIFFLLLIRCLLFQIPWTSGVTSKVALFAMIA